MKGPETSKTVQEAIEILYQTIGRENVSDDFEVCFCDCCFSQQNYQEFKATRNDKLPDWLIREYSNSAHGIPSNLNDLRLLLPRYCEMLSDGVLTDYLNFGDDLYRFGSTLSYDLSWLNREQMHSYSIWAKAAIRHLWHHKFPQHDGKRMCRPEYNIATFLVALIKGGVPAETCFGTVSKIMQEGGNPARIHFCESVFATQDPNTTELLFSTIYNAEMEPIFAKWATSETFLTQLTPAAPQSTIVAKYLEAAEVWALAAAEES